MKKILFLLLMLLLVTSLFAQSSETLDELRMFAQSALLKAEQQSRLVGTDTIVLGEILKGYEETPLGFLISDLFTAEVTNRSFLSLSRGDYSSAEEDFLVLEGVIHVLDDAVYMQLIIKKGYQSAPLAIIEKTMAYEPLSSLLYEEYYDDYSDTPVLREDNLLEPNDRVQESMPLLLGVNIDLALTPGDRDWFSFEIGEDQLDSDAYMVELMTVGDLDTYMEVYGPDDSDQFYGENDDYYDSNAGMVITVDAPGVYWVVVSGYSEDVSGYYTLESYGESVEFADQYEPNNSWDRPTELSWDEEQIHSFALGDNKDVFVFELDRTTEVTIFTQGDLDTYMDLYDEEGNYITGDDDGGKNSNARIEVDLGRGKYYLEVIPYDESLGGDYTLSAQRE
jgi:hypothetical protein